MIPILLVNSDMTLGKKIKQAREALGLNQTELARKMGTYQQRVGHWETGHTRLDPDELKEIAKALDKSPGWLLGEEENLNEDSELKRELFKLKEEAIKRGGASVIRTLRKILSSFDELQHIDSLKEGQRAISKKLIHHQKIQPIKKRKRA